MIVVYHDISRPNPTKFVREKLFKLNRRPSPLACTTSTCIQIRTTKDILFFRDCRMRRRHCRAFTFSLLCSFSFFNTNELRLLYRLVVAFRHLRCFVVRDFAVSSWLIFYWVVNKLKLLS